MSELLEYCKACARTTEHAEVLFFHGGKSIKMRFCTSCTELEEARSYCNALLHAREEIGNQRNGSGGAH